MANPPWWNGKGPHPEMRPLAGGAGGQPLRAIVDRPSPIDFRALVKAFCSMPNIWLSAWNSDCAEVNSDEGPPLPCDEEAASILLLSSTSLSACLPAVWPIALA